MVTTQLSIRFLVQANFTTEVTWRLIGSTMSDFDSFINERINNLYIPHKEIGLKADTNQYEVIHMVEMKSKLYEFCGAFGGDESASDKLCMEVQSGITMNHSQAIPNALVKFVTYDMIRFFTKFALDGKNRKFTFLPPFPTATRLTLYIDGTFSKLTHNETFHLTDTAMEVWKQELMMSQSNVSITDMIVINQSFDEEDRVLKIQSKIYGEYLSKHKNESEQDILILEALTRKSALDTLSKTLRTNNETDTFQNVMTIRAFSDKIDEQTNISGAVSSPSRAKYFREVSDLSSFQTFQNFGLRLGIGAGAVISIGGLLVLTIKKKLRQSS